MQITRTSTLLMMSMLLLINIPGGENFLLSWDELFLYELTTLKGKGKILDQISVLERSLKEFKESFEF
jgi:hypothetical protein